MSTRQSRRLRRVRVHGNDDDRILPLINVVFLLLIFFMVVGRLSAADPFEIVPTRSASEVATANEPMLLAIGPGGELALNGALIDEAALVAKLTSAETPSIRIKSDGRADAAHVVALLERLRLAGIPSVRLMTIRREAGSDPVPGGGETDG